MVPEIPFANVSLLVRCCGKRLDQFSYTTSGELVLVPAPIGPTVHQIKEDVAQLNLFLLAEGELTEDISQRNELLAFVKLAKLFNRLKVLQLTPLFAQLQKETLSLIINLPQHFRRLHECHIEDHICKKAKDIPNRNEYSQAIFCGGKYAYYRDYDGKEYQVSNLNEQEKRTIIEDEIRKNRADAQSIFLYTQLKRTKRLFSSQLNYFSRGELPQHIYDVNQRLLGSPSCFSHATPSVTTIGHATLLIQFPDEGINVLTDPIFYHVQGVFYRRQTEPAWLPHELPLIDVIIISHNHRDHVDEKSLRALVCHQPVVLVPLGDAPFMQQLGFRTVIEHDTWQETSLQVCFKKDGDGYSNLSFISVPANHWSCRGLHDANTSLFLGWVIQSDFSSGSIYFSGDTAVLAEADQNDIFLNPNYSPISLNLVPGGPNHERDSMKNTHASAAHGIFSHFQHAKVRATKEEKSSHFVQLLSSAFSQTMFMHHNTFELGIDRYNEAEYVREELLGLLSQVKTKPSTYPFIDTIYDDIIQLCIECDMEISKEENQQLLVEVVSNILNPKIGEVVLLDSNYP